ncbi:MULTISPECIES: hypothetical protein [Sorangium]|uniref:hypothetical protein n=1 Tax=Sorangium TaxID=39643 RepID=UPI00101A33B5|nr:MULTISPECIES: hypothetical protein [Sorangium]WCQ97099.1 hypothetical protein NQZ70_09890 [Sorangium sp. Soce836]
MTFTDPASYKLTYGYDALTQSYRTCVADSFGYRSNSVPNYAFGTVAQETDVNGHQNRQPYLFAGEAGIKSSGELIGKHGAFALPESAASRSRVAHALITGLSPENPARFVRVPGSFQRLFSIGIYSVMKSAGGVRFTAPGVITMTTGAFTQTGLILVPYAAVYGPDLLIYGAAAASFVAFSGMGD